MSDVIGCGDNSCVFRVLRKTHGMATNGGCRCFKNLEMTAEGVNGEPYSNHDDVRSVRQDTQRLSGELRRVKAQRDEALEAGQRGAPRGDSGRAGQPLRQSTATLRRQYPSLGRRSAFPVPGIVLGTTHRRVRRKSGGGVSFSGDDA